MKKQIKKTKKEKKFYDKSYKNIFENKGFIKALIKFVFPDKLIKQLNWKTLKSEKTNFIPKDLKSKEADAFYGMKLKNGKEIYIYFLIEFQTYVDKLMALRIFIYMALFYHHLLKMERIKRDVPMIIPIVLYTGDRKWLSAVKLSQLMDKQVYAIVKEYVPEIKYILIDKNKYTDEALKKMHNVISGLLYLEKMKKEDIKNRVKEFIEVFSKGIKEEEWEILKEYFKALFKQKFNKKIDDKIFKKKEEVNMMTTAIDEWREELLQEGKIEGELKGKLKVASKMISKGFKLPVIISVTGLKKNQIIKLRNKK